MSSYTIRSCKRKPNITPNLTLNCDKELQLDSKTLLYFPGHIAAFQDIVVEIQNPLVFGCSVYDLCNYSISSLVNPLFINVLDVLEDGTVSEQSIYTLPFDLESVTCNTYKYKVTVRSPTLLDLSSFRGCDVIIQFQVAFIFSEPLQCVDNTTACVSIPGSICVLSLPKPTFDLALRKTITSSGPYELGSPVTYDIEVFNIGNQSVNNVVVNDPLLSYTTTILSIAPGATVTLSPPGYTLTQSDLDSGNLKNIVSVTSDEADPEVIEVDLPLPQPAINIVKSGAIRSPGTGVVGDIIDYKYVVTNTGATQLTFVSTVDSKIPSFTPIEALLQPGGTVSYFQSYTITQADVDAGEVVNVATVTGQTGGTPVTDDDTVTITLP